MGWTCTHKPQGQSVAEFFHAHGVLRWPDDSPTRYRVLDTALVNLTEFYAALEIVDQVTGDRRVTAVVILVKMFKEDKSGMNFCWKDMDEDMGPYVANCPERILELLTPTENQNAIAWRQICRDKIEKKKQIPPLRTGVVIRFDKPIPFSSGPVSQLIVAASKSSRIYCTDEYGYERYRLTRPWLTRRVIQGGVTFA